MMPWLVDYCPVSAHCRAFDWYPPRDRKEKLLALGTYVLNSRSPSARS